MCSTRAQDELNVFITHKKEFLTCLEEYVLNRSEQHLFWFYPPGQQQESVLYNGKVFDRNAVEPISLNEKNNLNYSLDIALTQTNYLENK